MIEHLLKWFDQNKRTLPFRQEKDPYKIWISEIMAQQTQIGTLIPYYERFIGKFPNIIALAEAEEEAVLKYWEGLGYYSRARNLHKAAVILRDDFHGTFPHNPKMIQKLPGIGPYTCGAICSIAFNMKIPSVDGNVLRVVTRLNDWADDIALPQTKKKISGYLEEIMPERSGDFNESLMELGALICTPKSPDCENCPMRTFCLAYNNKTVEHIPVKSKKNKQKSVNMEVAMLQYKGKLLLIKRPAKGLLANLWSFPSIESNAVPGKSIEQFLTDRFDKVEAHGLLGNSRHVFTHIIWNIQVYGFSISSLPIIYKDHGTAIFADLEEIKEKYALPTAFSKLLNFYKSE